MSVAGQGLGHLTFIKHRFLDRTVKKETDSDRLPAATTKKWDSDQTKTISKGYRTFSFMFGSFQLNFIENSSFP